MSAFDVFGHALNDYLIGNDDTELILHNSYGDLEHMPVSVFFREPEDFTELERLAIDQCQGRTLDIGAGTGAITVVIQEKLDVAALELSRDACDIAGHLGVKDVINENIWKFSGQSFDTLFMIMNGLGIAGKLRYLEPFLIHLRTLLRPGGQILLDSSDLTYMHPDFKSAPELGEISYQYEYKGQKDPWFNWLYVGEKVLNQYALKAGLKMEILYRSNDDQYLARLTPQG